MNERLFLIAGIADRTVAIDADAVQSVVDIDAVVPVPGVDARVTGIAALRSRVVTVIDARVALGATLAPARARRAVVTCHSGHSYAVMVDALDDVAPFACEPLSQGVPLDDAWRPLGRGLVERDGETLLVVDLAALLPETAAA